MEGWETSANPPGSDIGESYEHWRRFLSVAMGQWLFCLAPGKRGFQSVAVPVGHVAALREYLARHGYETRISDAYTDEARMLTFWQRPLPALFGAKWVTPQ